MNYIESEEQYQAAMARIEELLPIVKEDTPEDELPKINGRKYPF